MILQPTAGPLRPPSEAHSLLVRVTENCPWNRCEFCSTFKGRKFRRRTVGEVKKDILFARRVAEEMVAWADKIGRSPADTARFNGILWLGNDGVKRAFLQDSDSLVMETKPLVEVLAIATLQSDALLRERAILYSEAQAPLTIRRYHYHFWTHVPGQLIQEQLLEYLRAAGIARSVIRYGEQPHADAVIEGYLKRFERQVGSGAPRAALALELVYRERAPESRPFMRTYEVVETATDESMHATVKAFCRALFSAGRRSDARMPMIAMTTSNSISVNAA